MSLENAIAENTAAIRELIEAIKQGAPTTQAQDAAAVAEDKPAKAEKPKAEKKAEAPKQEAAESSAAATQEPKEEAAAAEVSLDDVVAATLALGKAGKRQQLVEKLGELGAAKASALPEAEWAGYVEWANALLEA